MITRIGLALTLALAGLVIVAAGGAGAVAETCHSQTATIIGQPGGEVEGTDGPDVVVTNGALQVSTGSGDDRVCVTGGATGDGESVDIYVADGDDVVDSTLTQSDSVSVYLGQGDDAFSGGPGPESVEAADPWDRPRGQGDDVVSTGPGDDHVSTGGQPGLPDGDVIDLGSGDDGVDVMGPVAAGAVVHGGDGSDDMGFGRIALRRPLVIDNSVGRATDAGVAVLAWDGFERFALSWIGRVTPPAFIGGPESERLTTIVPLSSVSLGGGDDLVNLDVRTRDLIPASYDGGTGQDVFVLNVGAGSQARRIDVDVPGGRLFYRRDDGARMRGSIAGFEQYRLSADHLDFRGSILDEHVEWLGCEGVVDGGPGRDLIEGFHSADVGCGFLDEDIAQVVRGGRGDDLLIGTYARNILIGGPGDDVADGRGSRRDRCDAETERHCEL